MDDDVSLDQTDPPDEKHGVLVRLCFNELTSCHTSCRSLGEGHPYLRWLWPSRNCVTHDNPVLTGLLLFQSDFQSFPETVQDARQLFQDRLGLGCDRRNTLDRHPLQPGASSLFIQPIEGLWQPAHNPALPVLLLKFTRTNLSITQRGRKPYVQVVRMADADISFPAH